MSPRLFLFTALLLALPKMLPGAETGSPTNPGAIRVAKFKGDRAAALSFTLDDNLRNQYDVAVPLLNKYGIHATFFVIPGRTPETNEEAAKKKPGDWGGISWLQLKELAAQGHEIANHTWMHTTLINSKDGKREDIPTDKLEEQVAKGYDIIKEKIGVPPSTFCAPGNAVDEAVRAMALKYHNALRERHMERFGDRPPNDMSFTAEKANSVVDRHLAQGDQMVWMIHAVTDGYNAQSSPDVLGNHLKYVKSREDVLWVDTFAIVSRYILERDAAKLTGGISNNRASFTVECPLDQTKFHDPLTVIIPVKDAERVEAKQSGSNVLLPVEVREDRVLVQVVPSAQQVVVTWQKRKI